MRRFALGKLLGLLSLLVVAQMGCGGATQPSNDAATGSQPETSAAPETHSFANKVGDILWASEDETQIDLRRFAAGEQQTYDVEVGQEAVLPYIGVRVDMPPGLLDKLNQEGTEGVTKPAIRLEQLDPVDGREVRIERPDGGTIVPRSTSGKASIRVTNLLDQPLDMLVYTTPDTLTKQYGHEKTGAFNPKAYDQQKEE